MKKENIILLILRIKVFLYGREITEVYCDLLHIHYGWNKELKDYNSGTARNNYSEEDVISFFEQLNLLRSVPHPQKTNLKSVESRYVFNVYDEDKKLKMVVDFMKNKSTIVVTIF